MRVDFTSQDGQIDPLGTLWMTSVIESEEETIFINRITAGSASRVCNATHLIYQPQRRSSKLREFHKVGAVSKSCPAWDQKKTESTHFSSSQLELTRES